MNKLLFPDITGCRADHVLEVDTAQCCELFLILLKDGYGDIEKGQRPESVALLVSLVT
jgi:hypothetical protein